MSALVFGRSTPSRTGRAALRLPRRLLGPRRRRPTADERPVRRHRQHRPQRLHRDHRQRGHRRRIERGRSLLGTPYDFGGVDENGPSPYGIDCSGFIMYALAAAGVTGLPRTSQQQYDYLAGHDVSMTDTRPGDLIFESWGRTGTAGSPGAISHVAMYIGEGQVIEASRGAMKVKLSRTRFDSHAFVGIRRVLTNDSTTTEGN